MFQFLDFSKPVWLAACSKFKMTMLIHALTACFNATNGFTTGTACASKRWWVSHLGVMSDEVLMLTCIWAGAARQRHLQQPAQRPVWRDRDCIRGACARRCLPVHCAWHWGHYSIVHDILYSVQRSQCLQGVRRLSQALRVPHDAGLTCLQTGVAGQAAGLSQIHDHAAANPHFRRFHDHQWAVAVSQAIGRRLLAAHELRHK